VPVVAVPVVPADPDRGFHPVGVNVGRAVLTGAGGGGGAFDTVQLQVAVPVFGAAMPEFVTRTVNEWAAIDRFVYVTPEVHAVQAPPSIWQSVLVTVPVVVQMNVA
jgi:hypothetical protein